MKYDITLQLVVDAAGPATKEEVTEALVSGLNDRVYRKCPIVCTHGKDGNDELTEVFIHEAEVPRRRVWSWATSAAASSADGYYDVNYAVPPGLWLTEERAKKEAEQYFDNVEGQAVVWEPYPNPITGLDPWSKADLRYGDNTEIDEVVVVYFIDVED